MLALLLMLITSLPVFYYYYTMYQVNEKTRYLIGMVAGGWAFIGVFLVMSGIIRFWYFIIYILIVIFVYLFEKVMEFIDGDFDESEQEEYEIEWPVDVSNRSMAFLTLVLVIVLYCAVLIAPVSPARINDPTGFDEDEGSYKIFPDGYMYEYKKPGTYVVVLTIRSIPISQGMLDGQLEKGNKEVEEYIKEEYGEVSSIELTGEDEIDIEGYDAIEKDFDVRWKNQFGQFQTAEMTLQAFYYHNDFEVIVIGYFYPSGTKKATTEGILEDLEL